MGAEISRVATFEDCSHDGAWRATYRGIRLKEDLLELELFAGRQFAVCVVDLQAAGTVHLFARESSNMPCHSFYVNMSLQRIPPPEEEKGAGIVPPPSSPEEMEEAADMQLARGEEQIEEDRQKRQKTSWGGGHSIKG